MILFIKFTMITSLLLSTIWVTTVKNEQQQNSSILSNENVDVKSSYLKEIVTINIGKRARFECELTNLTNMK
ncbi:unnamed protein product, partial [Didymodactylos carnosus]